MCVKHGSHREGLREYIFLGEYIMTDSNADVESKKL